MPQTFGIEEEFMFLDRSTLRPVDLGGAAVDALGDHETGVVAREFFCSQIEYATPVCSSLAEARDALVDFRQRLGRWADDAGVVAAGTGTPFRARRKATVTPGERYERIAADIGGLIGDHQINGLHVHVGIPDRDSGIRALNALRPWIPVLLALSANSPFWRGRDTGYDSWRAIHSQRWTTHGIPPRFRDSAEYDRALEGLSGIGATSDAGTVNWNVRLSSRFPTLEVRVCDAQLDARSSLALAAVIRSLVTDGFAREPERMADACAEAALWHAARNGAGATLVHPLSGRPAPAAEVVRALFDRIAPRLDGRAESALVASFLACATPGARLQRRARSAGIPALAGLYADHLIEACVTRALPA